MQAIFALLASPNVMYASATSLVSMHTQSGHPNTGQVRDGQPLCRSEVRIERKGGPSPTPRASNSALRKASPKRCRSRQGRAVTCGVPSPSTRCAPHLQHPSFAEAGAPVWLQFQQHLWKAGKQVRFQESCLLCSLANSNDKGARKYQ